jgi:hypothetical protein
VSTIIESFVPTEEHTESPVYSVSPTVSPVAIVFFCCDPKIRLATESFIKYELNLGLEECVLVPGFGGVFCATEKERLPFEFRHFERKIAFSADKFPTIELAVGIGHDLCAQYADALANWGSEFLNRCPTLKARQEQDLGYFSRMVECAAPRPLRVRTFHMDLLNAERTRAAFREVG